MHINGCFIPTSNTIVTTAALVSVKPYSSFCAINNILPPKVVETDVVTIRTEESVKGMIRSRSQAGLIPASDSVFNIYGRECVFQSGSFGESKTYLAANLRRLADPDSACRMETLDTTKYFAGEAARMMYRTLVRIETVIWKVLFTGVFNIYDSMNNLVRQQFYPIRRLIANPFITDRSNSRPLSLFSNIAANFQETDVSFFGGDVEYWLNSVTFLKILENTNPEDLGRFNTGVCCTVMTVDQVNAVFASRGLGKFKICDSKYVNNVGVTTKFVKDGYVLIKGSLPGFSKGGWFGLVNPGTTSFGCLQNAGTAQLGGTGKGIWFKQINTCAISLNPVVEQGVGFDGMPIIPRPDLFISLRLF